MDARSRIIIAGEEDGLFAVANAEPGAAQTVAAAAPDQVQAAGQLRLGKGQAQTFQNDGIIHGHGQLLRSFCGHDHAAGKAVGKQIRQRAGLILMGMGQKQILRGADLLGCQVGQLVARIAALIAAVHDERSSAGLDKIAVTLLAARLACQIKLHECLPESARCIAHCVNI